MNSNTSVKVDAQPKPHRSNFGPVALLAIGTFGLFAADKYLSNDQAPEITACTYTVKPGDRFSTIASGRASITEELVKAPIANAQGEQLDIDSEELMPGYVLFLGETACSALDDAGKVVQWQTDHQS